MYSIAVELSRLAFVLFVRGVFLILMAALVIRWPEQTLMLAMLGAGWIVGSFGIFEVAAGSISRALPSTKLFLVAHGVISVAFGALVASIPAAPVAVAARLTMLFAVMYGVFSIVLAARLQFVPRARDAMFGWGIFNLACAAILASGRLSTTNALLYAGALYGGLLGLFQLVAALWIRRAQQVVERREEHRGLAAFR